MSKCENCYYWSHIKLDDNYNPDTFWGKCTNDTVNDNVVSTGDIKFSFEFCCYEWKQKPLDE